MVVDTTTDSLVWWMGDIMTKLTAVIAVGLAAFPIAARADVYCGSSPPNHDAPAGYLILSRAHESVISGVINALGEYRTHTMLSHGGWFTQATMQTPSSSSSAPHMDPNQLRFGGPGASQLSPAGAYEDLYDPSNGGADFVSKQIGGTEGQTVASWFWSTMGYRWVPPHCGSMPGPGTCTWIPGPPCTTRVCTSTGYYQASPYYDCTGTLRTDNTCQGTRVGYIPNTISTMVGGNYYRLQENGTDLPYSLHQFADISQVNAGTILASSDGVVCSTLQSYGVKKALGRTLVAPVYSHAQAAAAMTQFQSGVFNACKNSDFGLLGSIIDFFAFGTISDSKCNEAGNQAVNCLLTPGSCGSSSSGWTSARDNATVMARSISPDDISGWRPGEDYNDTTSNGPWAPANYDPLTFSGPGSVYSCWGN
jgi:hypothetical protein